MSNCIHLVVVAIKPMKRLLAVLTILSSSFVAIGQNVPTTLIIKSDTIFLDPDKVAHPEEGRELQPTKCIKYTDTVNDNLLL
jgi:hypothetical protein